MERSTTTRTPLNVAESLPADGEAPRCADPHDLRVDAVTGLADLRALHSEWQQLWLRCTNASPFQAPAWLLPWAEHFAPERTQALALRSQGNLCGLLPFFTADGAVLLAGTGPSDYGDALFADDTLRLATLALSELCAAAVALGCDRIDLQQLRPDSPLLQADVPAGWSDRTEAGTPCPIAPIRGERGLDAISAHWRGNARRSERLLRQDFAVDFMLGNGNDAAELERLHSLRWGNADATPAFSNPTTHAFLFAALPLLAQDGLLRMHKLTLDGQCAAMVFGLAAHDTLQLYMGVFDPQWSRYSTGLVTILHAMQCAAAEGARQLHFLRGSEGYKYPLGASDSPTHRRVLSHLGSAAA
jgi:CelD/BcsL family acetyltransferase involved in cellulose biosynthesis